MSVQVDLRAAQAALDKAWSAIGSDSRPPGRMMQLIEEVLKAQDVTFKYILITGYLAKVVNRDAHARAIQVSSSLDGAYDARSLCHKVVVGFEKSKGNLFGLSNEPFVNKPARHPEHDGENTQLRNKVGSKILHAALEQAQGGSPANVFKGLVHILRVGAKNAASQKQVTVTTQVNLSKVLSFMKMFLEEADGGSRLVGVWGAFQAMMSEHGKIKVYSPNTADFYGKTSGDVEVYYNGVLVSASECKQRALSLDDVNHGIKKATDKNVPEYLFVITAGVVNGQEASIDDAIKKHSEEVDMYLIDIWKHLPMMASLLNPERRGKFGAKVVELLREMRKFDSADKAATLWNSITGLSPT
jgi:hypothetical protein